MLLILLTAALAAPPPEAAAAEPTEGVQPTHPPPDDGFTFLGFYQARANRTNVITTNPFLDGQVVGALGGTNGAWVYEPGKTDLDGDGEPDPDAGPTTSVEQRLNGFFTYAPPILDGRAAVTAGFEVDFSFGDQAYSVGGNTGGGYGADQVNLQTRRLYTTFKPRLGPDHTGSVVLGLQFVADGVYDPAAAVPDDLFRAGGGLKFFGSEAAGLSVYGRLRNGFGDVLRYRLGSYTLVENGMSLSDDGALHMADVQWHPAHATRVGLHAWMLRDDTNGAGGVLGRGPTSALSELQGGPKLDLREGGAGDTPDVDGDLVWLTVDGGWNHRLSSGPVGLTAAATMLVGRMYVTDATDVDVQGWLVDTEGRWRWAPGKGSIVRLEVIATSRDQPDRGTYTGMVTGNSYGVVGAVYASHGTVLLFPDISSINRQISLVSDVSDQGDGLVAMTGSFGWDPVPNKVTVTAGGGYAQDGAGNALGTEINARVTWEPWLLCKVSAVAARVLDAHAGGADAHAGRIAVPEDPWAAYGYLEWVVF